MHLLPLCTQRDSTIFVGAMIICIKPIEGVADSDQCKLQGIHAVALFSSSSAMATCS